MEPRYDAHAAWYEAYLAGPAAAHTARTSEALAAMLGSGSGICLDVGCGTGVHAAGLQELGWCVLGVDVSMSQLALARSRLPVAAGDAERLPVASGSVDAVVATLIHTDVEDWSGVAREVARLLRPAGRFIYVGVHPCFVGPFADRSHGTVTLRPGYEDSSWRHAGPGLGSGVRSRVGVRHRTIAEVLNPLSDAGLQLDRLTELGTDALPDLLGISSTRR